jgi:hypothetical protein
MDWTKKRPNRMHKISPMLIEQFWVLFHQVMVMLRRHVCL